MSGGKDKNVPDTGTPVRPALTIDWELYAGYLDDADLPDEDKRAFIEALWSIIVGFVDLGFDIHPLQEVCEQQEDLEQYLARHAGDVVGSDIKQHDPLPCRNAHINSQQEGGKCDSQE